MTGWAIAGGLLAVGLLVCLEAVPLRRGDCW